MTRTTRQSDRRQDNDANNDEFNANVNTSDSNIDTPLVKRNRLALSDNNNNINNNDNDSIYNDSNNTNDDADDEQSPHPASASNAAGGEDDAQLPQFIASLHELISDPSTSHIVTWLPLPDGRVHFVVKDVDLFTSNILPKYYRTHKMTSFMRQLNNYGFSKVKSTDQNDKTYEFEHESNQLQPNRPDLLFKIERRRAVKRGSPAHGVKRSRPTGQQLFRTITSIPSSSHSPSSLSPRLSTAVSPAHSNHERDFAHNVVQAMRHLPGKLPVGIDAMAASVGADNDNDNNNDDDSSGPAKRRPLRSASLAARNAIKAAVQDYDDNGDAAAAASPNAVGGAGADDESSEFDDSPSASERDGAPRPASMSQLALVERGRTQLNRLRLHEEQPLSLERVPVAAPPTITTIASVDDLTAVGGESFAFAVPQVPPMLPQTTPTGFAFRLTPTAQATAQNQPPQVVVQARLGLTKSGEVWKSMIQSSVIEPSASAAAATPAVLFDLPRSNSVTDFFGIKRDAVDAGDMLDTGMLDDTRAFLKGSAGMNI